MTLKIGEETGSPHFVDMLPKGRGHVEWEGVKWLAFTFNHICTPISKPLVYALPHPMTHGEQFIQDGNIVLLKLRGLFISVFTQAREKFAFALVATAFVLAVLPSKYLVFIAFLEILTRYSPPRKATTERWTSRVREWWFSIPAAPFVLEIDKDDKKRR